MTVESDIENGPVQQQGANVVEHNAEGEAVAEDTKQISPNQPASDSEGAQPRSLPVSSMEDWNEKLKSVFSLA